MTEQYFSFKKKLLWTSGILALAITTDQWSKDWAVQNLKNAGEMRYLNDTVRFLYAENTGAWGSLGAELPEPWRWIILTLLPIVFLLGLLIYLIRKVDIPRYEVLCYALVIGGGVGNLIDRAAHGYVVDFLWMGFSHTFGTNIFNLADVLIMIGVITMVILQMYYSRVSRTSSKRL